MPNSNPSIAEARGRIPAGRFILTAVALAALLLLTACSMKVDDKKGAEKVDIDTPVGALHVHTDVDPSQIGLPVYPGARPKAEDDSGDKHRANVNISSSLFGVKVVALEYETDDPPDKLIPFYQRELKKYGKVLQCKGTGENRGFHGHHGDSQSHELTCDKDSDNGPGVELKAGTDDNEHLVAIEPQGKGSKFALVYVQTRGERQPI